MSIMKLAEELSKYPETEIRRAIDMLERRSTVHKKKDRMIVEIEAIAQELMAMETDGSKLRVVEDVVIATAQLDVHTKVEAAHLLNIDRKSFERRAARPSLAKTREVLKRRRAAGDHE